MGVRVAGLLRARTLVLVLILVHTSAYADPAADALLKFKNSLSNTNSLANWVTQAAPPCTDNKGNWAGVLCFAGNVRGLRLENMGLKGVADIASLAALPYFRTVSLMNNTLIGPVPDLKQLRGLRSVYLSYNHFSGQIPDDCFVGMKFLKKVLLSNNELEGRIPSSLATLPRLVVLRMDGNKFYGTIPNFGQLTLKRFNVSNNDLEGPIPESLGTMDLSSFSGNKNLCGLPLRPCSSPQQNIFLFTTVPEKYMSILKIVQTVLIIVLILIVLAAIVLIVRSRRKSFQLAIDRNPISNKERKLNAFAALPETNSDVDVTSRRSSEHGKLTFLKEDRQRFDLHDLLRASAEILGSGTFGSSYKATILSDSVVVKRYRQMNSLGREEFHEHMRRLGRLEHVNLLPLVAYYYRREEKLFVYDYVDNGSLAFHLHGNHNGDQQALDWPTRLRIAKGLAKGLQYLYTALPSLVVPHGHLKSSNIILTDSFDPLLTDYALLPAINLDHAHFVMMAYKSPEHARLGRITKKTDIWSLGIIILELLTGKFPENYLTRSYDPHADLATWVNDMIKERKTAQVFDVDMGGPALKSCRGEMLKLLKIGLNCCEEDLERRLELSEVVEKIDELSGNQGRESISFDGDFYGGIGDPEEGYISRAI